MSSTNTLLKEYDSLLKPLKPPPPSRTPFWRYFPYVASYEWNKLDERVRRMYNLEERMLSF